MCFQFNFFAILHKKQIYIVYLTRTDNDTHSEQTWGEKYKSIDFNSRYTILSYESKILPWLESFLNTLCTKEELIKSAIVQYIDHLKHIFNNVYHKDLFNKLCYLVFLYFIFFKMFK